MSAEQTPCCTVGEGGWSARLLGPGLHRSVYWSHDAWLVSYMSFCLCVLFSSIPNLFELKTGAWITELSKFSPVWVTHLPPQSWLSSDHIFPVIWLVSGRPLTQSEPALGLTRAFQDHKDNWLTHKRCSVVQAPVPHSCCKRFKLIGDKLKPLASFVPPRGDAVSQRVELILPEDIPTFGLNGFINRCFSTSHILICHLSLCKLCVHTAFHFTTLTQPISPCSVLFVSPGEVCFFPDSWKTNISKSCFPGLEMSEWCPELYLNRHFVIRG